jgi:hypothetical protein
MDKCRRCQAPILWANHFKTGKANPLDDKPAENGNLLLARGNEAFEYEVLTGEDLVRAHAEQRELYISHFATCSYAQQFRKKEKAVRV